MVGDLPTAVHGDDRYIAGFMQMFLLAIAPECEYRGVFEKPEFIRGIGMTRLCKGLHFPPDGCVIHQPKVSDRQGMTWHDGASLLRGP
jgi:hypothetical protein